MIQDSQSAKGSGRPVTSLSSFCEGDVDPTLNKRIRELIDTKNDYLVYLDEDFAVQWTLTDNYGDYPPGFPDIASRIGNLETHSGTQLYGEQKKLFQRLLAEGMARTLGDKDEKKAHEILGEANAYLQARGSENGRTWYLEGSSVIAVLLLVATFVLWSFRGYFITRFGAGFFEVLLGMCLGGPGALLSILFRFEKIAIEPAAGSRVHYIEGAARILAGSLGALLAALIIKGNIALGIIKSVNYHLPALLAICFVAGASERFVRGIIKKMETMSPSH